MRRRLFITLLGGAAVAWPLAARAQQAGKVHRIGFLGGADPVGYAPQMEGLRLGLRDHAYVEGKNTVIEERWAEGKYDRLPALAAELVQAIKVDIIITQGTPAAVAAKRATTTIPDYPGISAAFLRRTAAIWRWGLGATVTAKRARRSRFLGRSKRRLKRHS